MNNFFKRVEQPSPTNNNLDNVRQLQRSINAEFVQDIKKFTSNQINTYQQINKAYNECINRGETVLSQDEKAKLSEQQAYKNGLIAASQCEQDKGLPLRGMNIFKDPYTSILD